MERLSIEEILSHLDSIDILTRQRATQIVEESLSENEHTLYLLLDHYYVTNSEQVLSCVINSATEGNAQKLYDWLLEFNDDCNYHSTLSLLCALLTRKPEPTWIYTIVETPLFQTILSNLQLPSHVQSLPLGVVLLTMLLPLALRVLEPRYKSLMAILSCAVQNFTEQGIQKQKICFHFLKTLYVIYPHLTLQYCRDNRHSEAMSSFIRRSGEQLKLHSALYSPTMEAGVSLDDQESHDIIWDISCYSEGYNTCLLEAAQSITSGEGEKDITAGGTNDLSTQTEQCCDIFHEMRYRKDNLVDPAIEENLLQPYLQRRLEASAVLFSNRPDKGRIEEKDVSPETAVLEGELMLERYLRYQHERRNRRYLSTVLQAECDLNLLQSYEQGWNMMVEKVARAEATVAEMCRQRLEERKDTNKQLEDITYKLNVDMRSLKERNLEMEEKAFQYSEEIKNLQHSVEQKRKESDREFSKNYDLAEKVKTMDAVQKMNDTLQKKVVELQNQFLLVNEIRSQQRQALLALKPFCNQDNQGMNNNSTPDYINLQKYSADLQKKFSIAETDNLKLKASIGPLNGQVKTLQDKIARQKKLTEQASQTWEEKYSALEKTRTTYRNICHELGQHILKFKKKMEEYKIRCDHPCTVCEARSEPDLRSLRY